MTSVRYGAVASQSSNSIANSWATSAKSRRSPPDVGRGGDAEVDAHEEPSREAVAELLALEDVAAVAHQEAADRVHDPGAVGAREDEDEVARRRGRGGGAASCHDRVPSSGAAQAGSALRCHGTQSAIRNNFCASVPLMTTSAEEQRTGPRDGVAPGVQSVDRALTILEVLARIGEAGVTEIAGELGVHKSTAFRLVATLEAHRLVEQTGDRGKYRLGVGVLRLAGATTARLDVVQEARPVCRQLAADTGETVNIAVLSESSALYLDQVAGSSALQPHNWVGQHIPLHATSNGKVLLSGLDPTLWTGCCPRCRRTRPARSPGRPSCARSWTWCASRGTPSPSTSSRSG